MRMSLMLVLVVFVVGVPSAIAQESRSLSENPIWLRAACFATGLRPAVSTIYTDIACFAVLASHKTARSRADDGILRHTPRLSEKQKSQLIKRFPESDANKDGKLDAAELRALRDFLEARRNNAQLTPASNDKADADTDKWKTVGFRQGNTMGGGEAAISKGGKFRVFILMGQSNMHGLARAAELKSPYT